MKEFECLGYTSKKDGGQEVQVTEGEKSCYDNGTSVANWEKEIWDGLKEENVGI